MAAAPSSAVAALRCLAAAGDTACTEALSHLSKRDFKRLRRAIVGMLTPPSSSDEGGHPGGAGGASDVVGDRLDQAAKANNSDTVLDPGANINNASDDVQAEEISLLGPIVGRLRLPSPAWRRKSQCSRPHRARLLGSSTFLLESNLVETDNASGGLQAVDLVACGVFGFTADYHYIGVQ